DNSARLAAMRRRIQEIMRDDVSVVRSAESLTRAMAELDRLADDASLEGADLPARCTRDMLILAQEIAASALEREESRGGHFRSDYPDTDPSLDGQHQLVARSDSGVAERSFGDLATAWTGAVATR
ncbi:MAG TPA: hypothetical protein VD789_13995, partial [Thermomicrobiales bacterium]|nr:hypothetical protein [Thermomicrobiales bacterium]